MSEYEPTLTGWSLDVPDARDYSLRHEPIEQLFASLKPVDDMKSRVDLRNYCSLPPSDPEVGSAAVAIAGMVEYYERRAAGSLTKYSALFLDRVSRKMSNERFGSGRSLRCVCKALGQFGVPPEPAWAPDPQHLDRQPDAFAFAMGQKHAGTMYVRLDYKRRRGRKALRVVRNLLAAGYPSAFGFSVYDCVTRGPEIPYPAVFHSLLGGQAVLAVGYDDNRRVQSDKGALLIRNGWGSGWGDGGYGWLPYSYLLEGLAADFWTLVSPRWLSSGDFYGPP